MRLFTVSEVADFLHLSEHAVRAMAREGRLPAYKVGGLWRFDLAVIAKATMNGGTHERTPGQVVQQICG